MNLSAGTLSPAIPHRRKHRNSSMASVLRRKYGILANPLFQWKHHKKHSALAAYSSPVNFRKSFQKSELSARKLAAGLWQLRFMEVSGDCGAAVGDGSFHSSKSQLADENVKLMFPKHHNTGDKFKKAKALPWRPLTILRSTNGIRCEFESSPPHFKCSKEKATKWDPDLPKVSNEFTQIYSRMLVDERELRGDFVVSDLLVELLQAQRCINKLKAARNSSKKKVEGFLQKLEHDIIFWKHRERQKIQAVINDLKDRLERERKSRERIELLNSKLVHDLAEADLSAKQLMKKYEEAQRDRELMEEVCNELAEQIGEDKAKLEELQRESVKIQEEVEEERKMLQMAELWREERVQMKLVDAKLALEDKYNQMIQLIAYLQTFLRSRGALIDTVDPNPMEVELIKQAAESIDIQRIVELAYDFSKSDDIFAIYEELRKDSKDRVIKPYCHPSPTGPSSTIHIVSLDEDGFNKNSVSHQSSCSTDYNTGLELTNARETVSHVEDRDSTFPPLRRDTFVDSVNQENILESEAECSKNTDLGSPNCKASSASILRLCQSNGTASTVAKTPLHRKPGNGGYRYQDSEAQQFSPDFMLDDCNRGLSTGSIQSVRITYPCKGSGKDGFKHQKLLGRRKSKDVINPHITRGMKGCIEWPRGIPRTNLKAISLEARVRSQKSQLQHILKPKA